MPENHGITNLEIAVNRDGRSRIINPALIWDENHMVLIDTGFPGQLPEFTEAFKQLGLNIDQLDKIIITHQDRDHIGGLPEITNAASREVEVLAHTEEKPLIQGDVVFIKKTQGLKAAHEVIQAEAAKPATESFVRGKVQRVVVDGEALPYCGGITVIHTPGHTPGHICLYHSPSKTLISGDALNVVDGYLTGPNPLHTDNLAEATESLKKLSAYEIQTVICYHGGAYEGNANQRIAELANG